MLLKVCERCVDLFFPPNETEKVLRKISVETIYLKCQKNITDSEDIYSIFSYKDVFIKDAIYELKNNRNKYAIKLFGELLYTEIIYFLEESLLISQDSIEITFIPQHKNTFLDKGYNQAKDLVEEIAKKNKEVFIKLDVLKKIKKTKPQHEISNKKERLKNLQDVFICTENISNKIIILIDDVTTTGATIKEVRRQLLAAGASKVVCFTIAH
jgi:competence protein ComFC